jgi:plastocyanin
MKLTMTAVIALLALGAGVGLAACGSDSDTTAATTTSGDERAATEEANGTASAEAAAEGDAMKHEGEGVETIVVRNGEPVGGVAELEYSAGEEVKFKVRSDVADEVHVHGYDISKDVEAGGTVSFSFPAELEGIFEVELEERAEQIAELRVNP